MTSLLEGLRIRQYGDSHSLLTSSVVFAIICGVVTVLFFARQKRLPKYAAAIQKDLRIQKLLIHPIKSCRGTSVAETEFDAGGFRFDRSWLIIDAVSRKFQTARDLPQMITISPVMKPKENILEITIPLHEKGKGSVVVRTPLEPSADQLAKMELVKDITVWSSKVDGYAVSQEADESLTTFFGRPVRLVRKGPLLRNAGPDDPRGDKSEMHYQDFYPILLASSASIKHVCDVLVASIYPHMLSSLPNVDRSSDDPAIVKAYKVSDKISREYWTPEQLSSLPIERFRPNIVVESFNDNHGRDQDKALSPWEEDGWTHIEVFDGASTVNTSIGRGTKINGSGTSFDCVAKCGRCMVPNVDGETGVRDSFVPYTIMQRFRQVQPEYARIGKPCFGVHTCPIRKAGVLRVGDIVRVTSVTDPKVRKMKK